jgi:ubiquinol-cytochrome c reductase iron-sulfur subunit
MATGDDAHDPSDERRATRIVAVAFGASMSAGLALLALYILGGQTQLEAILLAIVLAGLGVGLVVWSHRLMPVPTRVEERHPLESDVATRAALVDGLTTAGAVDRRGFLVRLLAGAVAALGAALAMPLLSLGPAPGRSLFQTAWRKGSRLVGPDGMAIRADSLPQGSIATVFPEGALDAADSQTLLLHVDPASLRLQDPGADWAPEGFVAYSKVCTHAGCPVGLYRQEAGELICPCHQSTFDALRGAVPISGPAVRPLPQLPIRLEDDGTFTALSDFPEPVGPSFWDIHG